MATQRLGAVTRHLRELVAAQRNEKRTDHDLLGDFIVRNDQGAFAAIVRRHGPMVYSVCRRVLHQEQDAEDAFQATFLVLARKAMSVQRGEALPSWLHGVAYHVSTRARRDAARRREHEAQAKTAVPTSPAWRAAWREVQTLLDEEIQGLPEKLRGPFVRCILEGQRRAEAARQLGLKEGTVWSRLSQARKQLQARLARRGVTLSAVLAGSQIFLTRSRAPAALVEATVQTAGAGSSSSRVLSLTETAIKTMFAEKMKTGAALLLVCGMVVAGAGFAAHQILAAKPVGPPEQVNPALPSREENQQRVAGKAMPRLDTYGDPLPNGSLFRLGTERLRHGGGGGGTLTFSSDGTSLISAHSDGTVHFWDAVTGKEFRVLRTNFVSNVPGPTLCLRGMVAALPIGNLISMWDLAAGKELHHDIGHGTHEAPYLAFSADGKLAATGSSDGVRLWEVRTAKELRRFEGHRAPVVGLAFAPSGKVLAAKGNDGNVLLWDIATGKELPQMQGNPSFGSDLVFARDGKVLGLGKDNSVLLLDVATGQPLRRLDGPDYPVHSLAFSPDGRTVAAGSLCSIHFWEVQTGKVLHQIDLAGSAAGCLAFSPDGKTLANAGTGCAVRLWDIATGKELHNREGHRGPIHSVGFSPEGRLLATTGDDSAVRFWDTKTGKQVGIFQTKQRMSLYGALFSPDGDSLFTFVISQLVLEWDVATGKEKRRLEFFPGEPQRRNQVYDLALSPSGTTLTAVSLSRPKKELEQILTVWDLQTGKQRVESLGLVEGWAPALAPDGTLIACLQGPSVRIHDIAAGKDLFTLVGPGKSVVNVAFTLDNRALAGVFLVSDPAVQAREIRTVVVWELATGKELHRAELGNPVLGYGSPLAFSRDVRFLAAGGDDPAAPIRLWDLTTGKEALRLEGQRGNVTSLAFSPDGTKLASGMRNGVALVWDIAGSLPRPALPTPMPAQRLKQLWTDLGDEKPALAHAAIWELAAAPGQAVALLRENLRPVAAVEPKELACRIADLDSDQFAVRQAASRELEKVGGQAETALRRALERNPSPEVRRCVEGLLEATRFARSPETVRGLRAIQVLEWIGTKETRQLLEALAEGAAAARETQEAKAALRRPQRRRG